MYQRRGGVGCGVATIVDSRASDTRAACHTLLPRVPRSVCVRDWGGKEEEREGPVGTRIEVMSTWLIAGTVDTADRGRAAAFWAHTSINRRPSVA